jgi:hypothetical protein
LLLLLKIGFIRIKRTLAKLMAISPRRSLFPAAALRPYRRSTTADRQAVHGLPSGADVLSAPLRALCGYPAGLRDASGNNERRLSRYKEVDFLDHDELKIKRDFPYQIIISAKKPTMFY